MSDLSFSSIIKQSFDRGTLCVCSHRRLDHHLIDVYSEEDFERYGDVSIHKYRPLVSCVCPCDRFKKASNLQYLEMLQTNSEAGPIS